MSYDSLLTISCSLVSRDFDSGVEDEHGSPVPVETLVASRCYLSRQRHVETGDPQTQVETFTVFLPADSPVTGWDAIDVAGQRYELLGPPSREVRALTGIVHHVEATIQVSDPTPLLVQVLPE